LVLLEPRGDGQCDLHAPVERRLRTRHELAVERHGVGASQPSLPSDPSVRIQRVGELHGRHLRGARPRQAHGLNASLTLNRARDIGNNYNSIPNDQRLGVAGEYGHNADTPTARGVVSGWYDITPTVQVSAKYQARTGMWVNPVDSGVDLIGAGILSSRTPGFARNSFEGPGFNQT